MPKLENINRDGSAEVSFLDKFPTLEREYASLPFSDFKRWVPWDDQWIKFEGTFPIGRLGRLKQLGFLSYTGPNPENTYFVEYSHTRGMHTQQVALVGREIVRQNGGNPWQQELMMTDGGLHDIATVAQGDAIKLIDRQALDEEDHWKDTLDESGLAYLKKRGFSIDEIDKAIHNIGVYGKILDVADRISYVMQDVYSVLPEPFLDKVITDPYTSSLRNILLHDKKVGNIYKDVAVDWKNGDVVFTNQERLGVFLHLRAHMHLSNYMYPTNQARDTFIANMVRPFYSRNESSSALFTPNKLRSIDDNKVMDALSKAYGLDKSDYGQSLFTDLINWHPKTELFRDQEGANKRLAELENQPDVIVIGKRQLDGFDPGTGYLVVDGNRIVPYSDVGKEASSIERIARSLRGVNVFYTPNDNSVIGRIARQVRLIGQ